MFFGVFGLVVFELVIFGLVMFGLQLELASDTITTFPSRSRNTTTISYSFTSKFIPNRM